MKRVASTISTMLMGVLVFVVLFSSTSKGHSPLEVWIPYFPDTSAVKLDYWKENGLSYIGVSIYFPSTGYNITDWGTPITAGNNISANAEIWDWTGADLPMVIERYHNYCLGDLTAGEYLFTFKTWDFPVRNIRFAVYIVVPDDYSTIQEAINNAEDGDTVFVRNGTYYEHVVVNKTVSIVGENKNSTIIDGSPITPELDYVIIFLKDMRNVYISGFTLRNGPLGIELDHSHNCTITDNIITMNYGGGIVLFDSNFNNLTGNAIVSNEAAGIDIVWSDNNYVIQNNLLNNTYGLYLQDAYNNIIYHNCFLDNDYCPASSTEGSVNVWDNGYPSGGNYWSDYETRYPDASEIDGSGIWNTPYVIDENNQDNYPLMSPWTPTPPVITATVDIHPQTLNLRSKGKWITAFIELPEDYNVSDINASSILLNDTIPVDPSAPISIGDYNGDGIPDLMVKFDRAEVISCIIANVNMTELVEERFITITLTITGYLYGDILFQGSDTIRIMKPPPRRGGGRYALFK